MTPNEFGENRSLFLRAGAALLEDAPAAISMRALTVRAVTKHAGKSTGAFYHYWQTQADFIVELIPHVLLGDVVDEVATSNELLEVARSRMDAEAVFQVFESSCDALIESSANRIQHLLWSVPDSPVVLSALRDTYRQYQSAHVGMYQRIFEATDAVLVDGVTFDDLAVMITALLDGVSMRRRLDPDAADAEMARRMIASLLLGVMAPRGVSVLPWTARLDALLSGAGTEGSLLST